MTNERPLLEMFEKVTGRKASVLYGQGNPDVLDESHDVNVALLAYPSIAVISINAPTGAYLGDPVDINFTWQNNGGDGWAWWRVIDLDTMVEYIPRTTGGATTGSQLLVTVPTITMPNRALRVRIEVGHIE